jgi:hypothetical protein
LVDVYRDAADHKVIVVGGSARTVGAAGGWLLGGGVSPFSQIYGLGVDSMFDYISFKIWRKADEVVDLLQVTIVTPTGEHKTLNEFLDPDYFWAIRGGGGSNWGVITSVTYKTHPEPNHMLVAGVQVNFSSVTGYRAAMSIILPGIVDMAAAGFTGYSTLALSDGSLGMIFLQPNGTQELLNSGISTLQMLSALDESEGVTGVGILNFTLPTWFPDYTNLFLHDPNIATNIQDASRILTPEVLVNKTNQLINVILDFPDLGAGFNFSEFCKSLRFFF